jgi:hypothetical protein
MNLRDQPVVVQVARLFAVAFAAIAPQAALGQYQVKLLHPEGYEASAAGASSHSFNQAGSAYSAASGALHAMYWQGSSHSAVDLHPEGFEWSSCSGAVGGRQIGYASLPNGLSRALLWNGSANDYVDLTPESSSATGMGMDEHTQVGYAYIGGITRAVRWQGTPESCVDLHPDGFNWSSARAVSGASIVGNARPIGQDILHAMQWVGSVATDLHPQGFVFSTVNGTDAGTQVGYAGHSLIQFDRHALLWTGSPATVVDLHPLGFTYSEARGTLNGIQVGYAGVGGRMSAFLWNGNAASAFNLHGFTAGLTMNGIPMDIQESTANGIDPAGNITGVVYSNGRPFAVQWQPVPEPTTLLVASVAALFWKCRRRPR